MEISERIKKIIESEGLTASAFADAIGVQRSNVSQIMSGRQKPSFELLQKIMTSFPKYNADWLVMGRGEIRRQPVQMTIFDEIGEPEPADILAAPVNDESVSADSQQEPYNEQEVKSADVQNNQPSTSASDGTNSAFAPLITDAVRRSAEVKQIAVLYADNTFSIYNKQ